MTKPIVHLLERIRDTISGFKLRSSGEKAARANLVDEINAAIAAKVEGVCLCCGDRTTELNECGLCAVCSS